MIERQNIRGDEDGDGSVEEDELYYLQLAQMVVILFSLLAVSVYNINTNQHSLELVLIGLLNLQVVSSLIDKERSH